jgi:NADPH-dependent ferric siderophore reductase
MALKIRRVSVSKVEDLIQHMKRIYVQGNDLSNFPLEYEGAHVKVVFPENGEKEPKLSFLTAKKSMRSYTVRAFDEVKKEMVLDFAVNDHQGLASNWALKAKVGDRLGLAGPGDTKYTDYQAAWHLIVADLTGLPAAAVSLEKLGKDAQGYAIIQVPNKNDIQEIDAPLTINIEWIVSPYQKDNLLLNKVKRIVWLNESPAIFIACESSHMKDIKKFVKEQPGYQKSLTYASGYWKK